MIDLEDMLIEELGETAFVDGHDVGIGRVNIFIITPDPFATFERAKPVIARRPAFAAMRAAYRETEGETSIMIWPDGAAGEELIGL
jgi:hypothetical protein